MRDLDSLVKRFGGELGYKIYRGLPLSKRESVMLLKYRLASNV